MSFFIYEFIRYLAVVHGIVLGMLVIFIMITYKKDINFGYSPKNSLKFKAFQLLSYFIAITFITATIIGRLGKPDFKFYAPVAILCWIFGDIGFYYKFKNRNDNEE